MLRDAELRELLDRSRISDTIYAYCDYVDRGDVDAVVALFVDEGIIDLGGGAVHHGHAELHDMFTDRFQLYSATSYHCSNIRLVSYDGETAATTAYLYGIHDAPRLNRQMHLWGRFDDDLVNDGGTWLFQRRRLRVAGLNHTASEEIPKRFNRIAHALSPEPKPPTEGPLRSLTTGDTAGRPTAPRRRVR